MKIIEEESNDEEITKGKSKKRIKKLKAEDVIKDKPKKIKKVKSPDAEDIVEKKKQNQQRML